MTPADGPVLHLDAGFLIFLFTVCFIAAAALYLTVTAISQIARGVRYQQRYRRLRDHLTAETERLHPGTDGCDPETPCSLWDFRGDRPVEIICRNHLPEGRHHPPPLLYGPEPVVGHCEWADEMEQEMQR